MDPHNTQRAVPATYEDITKSHTTYHENQAKKILYTKLDPSLGFAFLLKSDEDLVTFKNFMAEGKKQFPKNWIFYSMETKPDYMRDKPKKKKNKKKAKLAEVNDNMIEETPPVDNRLLIQPPQTLLIGQKDYEDPELGLSFDN